MLTSGNPEKYWVKSKDETGCVTLHSGYDTEQQAQAACKALGDDYYYQFHAYWDFASAND